MKARILAALALLPLGACASNDDLVEGGVAVVRSACPMAAVAEGTGDITLFDPPASRDAAAIDVVANLTNLRATCNDVGTDVVTTLTFDIQARRSRADGPREVVLPYFTAVVRGGNAVTAKRIGRVALRFDAGQLRASAQATATTSVTRAATALPEDIRDKLTKKRKAGQEDAAIDPLSQPDVRQAVLRATFEALVGFQLTDEQLRYNATR